jgi:fructose-1,6-bisphosphatase
MKTTVTITYDPEKSIQIESKQKNPAEILKVLIHSLAFTVCAVTEGENRIGMRKALIEDFDELLKLEEGVDYVVGVGGRECQ